LDSWSDFCVAQIGASAALAGLVIVGVTINLDDIIASPPLPNRVLKAVLLLVIVLFECSVLLAPHLSTFGTGLAVLLLGLAFSAALLVLNLNIYRETAQRHHRRQLLQIVVSQFASLSFVMAGIWVLFIGEGGFSWFLPGTLFCYAAALAEAWVLLIEIKR
jgi:hypothetical protein